MRAPLAVLLAVSAISAFGAYTYQYTDTLGTINTSNWTQNGTVSAGPFTTSNSNGGSIIYKGASPVQTSGMYEAKMTLNLTASGGTFVMYLNASSNALSGPASQGSYYAFEIQNPTFSGSACTATLAMYKSVSGTVTSFGTNTVPCSNGVSYHVASGFGGQHIIYTNGEYYGYFVDTALTGGAMGVGVRGAPSGNSVSEVDLGPQDTVAPGAVSAPTIATSVFPNYVDVRWQGTVDDPNGIGLWGYQMFRDGTYIALKNSNLFTDETLSPYTTYHYQVYAIDWHMNASATTDFYVTTPPTGSIDPRRVGVKPTGTYWGGMGENIDLLSGNINYSVPLLKAQGRGGWAVPIQLNYNSQNWRQDPSGTWNLGEDVGYGYGWKLLAGSLEPYYSAYFTLDHYTFTDSSGARYRLNVNTGGVWTSQESIYVSYDSNAQKLYFRDGSYWVMGCTSAGTEQDAGTLYPTAMEDTNGNVVNVTYYAGIGVTWTNSSARINTIEDVRAQPTGVYPYTYVTYQFNYNTDPIPHLTSVTNDIHTAEGYTFAYSGSQPLQSPFSPPVSFGTADLLQSVTISGVGFSYAFTYDANDSGQLDQVTLPYGGHIRWAYTNLTYAGTRIQPEIATRYLSKDGVNETAYPIYHAPGESGNVYIHVYSDLFDPGGVGEKVWWFTQDTHGSGVTYIYEGRQRVSGSYIAQVDVVPTWTTDAAGNSYIGTTLTTQDQGTSYQIQKKVTQTLDSYGNMTQMLIYNWGSLSTPARTYTNTYVTSSTYTSRYIYNRMLTSTLTGASTTTTLVQNTYDGGSLVNIPTAREHDSAYGTTFYTRGLVTTRVTPVDTYTMQYDIGGNMVSTTNSIGTVTGSTTGTTNYAAPDSITANSLTDSMGYASFLGLTNEAGPNGDSSVTSFDSYARPYTNISPYGATTTYTYSASLPATVTATVNGRWTQTTLDGLGRQLTLVTGYGTAPPGTGGTKISEVDYYYDSCACSPMGKLFKQSQPYVPGATVYWTQYTYDGIGRTTSVVLPNNPATSATWGTTAYLYQGNTVKTTDPAGNWKTFTMDAMGNLTNVLEPNPAGGTFNTSYTYDILNHLTGIPTLRGSSAQTRTFNYTSGGYVGAFLLSKTEPETGTTTYTYQAGGLLASKIDATNQQTKYSFDSLGRTTQIRHYPVAGGAEDTCQQVNFYYDSNPFAGGYSQYVAGRLAAVEYQGANCTSGALPTGGTALYPANPNTFYEMYSYTQPGQKSAKRLQVGRVVSGTTVYAVLDSSYTYDNEGRMTGLTYPGSTGSTGDTYAYTFDSMGRPTRLNDSTTSTDVISTATFGPAGELLTLNGPGYSESRSYNTLFQLSTISGNGINQTYNYSAGNNNGKAASVTDAVSAETVTYTYDALNRLTQALSSSSSAPWGQSFNYDIFGNLTDKNVIAGSAPTYHTSFTSASNRDTAVSYDANGNQTNLPGGSGMLLTYDVLNRLVTTYGVYTNAQTLYQYGPGNARVYQGNWTYNSGTGYSTLGTELVYFYSVVGQKIGTFQLTVGSSSIWFAQQNTEVWFGAKLVSKNGQPVVADRLGSFGKYYPYGEDRGSGNPPNDQEKFATYTRDSASGLDYAMNRYSNSVAGRFMTADPTGVEAVDLDEPSSWNAYSYSGGDPINFNDPDGTTACGDLQLLGNGTSLRSAVTGGGDTALLAQLVWAESDHTWSRQFTQAYYNEQDAVAWTVVNRQKILDGYLSVGGVPNPSTLGWGPNGASISQIIGWSGQFSTIVGGSSNPQLRSDLQSSLQSVLAGSPSGNDEIDLNLSSFGLGSVSMTHECFDVWQSWVGAHNAITGSSTDPFAGQGYTTSFHHGVGTTQLEGYFGNFGDANNFFGIATGLITVNSSPKLPPPKRISPTPPRRRGRKHVGGGGGDM